MSIHPDVFELVEALETDDAFWPFIDRARPIENFEPATCCLCRRTSVVRIYARSGIGPTPMSAFHDLCTGWMMPTEHDLCGEHVDFWMGRDSGNGGDIHYSLNHGRWFAYYSEYRLGEISEALGYPFPA